MDRFKILLVSTNADLSGAPLHVKEICLSLERVGHHVAVVFGSPGPTQQALHHRGIKTFVINEMRSAISPLLDLRAYRRLLQIASDERADVLHCHSSKAGMLGRLVGARLKVPCIYTVHGWGFGRGRKRTRGALPLFIEYLLKRPTTHYVAVSIRDRELGIRWLGISPEMITTIRNGISATISPSHL